MGVIKESGGEAPTRQKYVCDVFPTYHTEMEKMFCQRFVLPPDTGVAELPDHIGGALGDEI